MAFYTGISPDSKGRFLDDILGFSNDQLECVHDYIQWLFPLDTPSQFNPHAPLLTPSEIAQFRNSQALRDQVILSLQKMLTFFGFSLYETEGTPSIERSPDFSVRKKIWLKSCNHNVLRISRMIRSMSLLGLSEHSQAFLDALSEIPRYDRWRLGSDSYQRWKENL